MQAANKDYTREYRKRGKITVYRPHRLDMVRPVRIWSIGYCLECKKKYFEIKLILKIGPDTNVTHRSARFIVMSYEDSRPQLVYLSECRALCHGDVGVSPKFTMRVHNVDSHNQLHRQSLPSPIIKFMPTSGTKLKYRMLSQWPAHYVVITILYYI